MHELAGYARGIAASLEGLVAALHGLLAKLAAQQRAVLVQQLVSRGRRVLLTITLLAALWACPAALRAACSRQAAHLQLWQRLLPWRQLPSGGVSGGSWASRVLRTAGAGGVACQVHAAGEAAAAALMNRRSSMHTTPDTPRWSVLNCCSCLGRACLLAGAMGLGMLLLVAHWALSGRDASGGLRAFQAGGHQLVASLAWPALGGDAASAQLALQVGVWEAGVGALAVRLMHGRWQLWLLVWEAWLACCLAAAAWANGGAAAVERPAAQQTRGGGGRGREACPSSSWYPQVSYDGQGCHDAALTARVGGSPSLWQWQGRVWGWGLLAASQVLLPLAAGILPFS